jgi:hypothetical protein
MFGLNTATDESCAEKIPTYLLFILTYYRFVENGFDMILFFCLTCRTRGGKCH